MYPTYHLAALTRGLTGTPIVLSGRRDLRGTAQPLGRLGGAMEPTARRMTDAVVANSEAVGGGHDRPRAPGARPPARDLQRRRARAVAHARGARGVPPRLGRRPGRRAGRLRRQLPRGQAPRGPGRRVRRGRRRRPGPAPDPDRRGPDAAAARGAGPRAGRRGPDPDPRRRGGPRPMFEAFDIVAHASESEGLPNALLEAASAGLPSWRRPPAAPRRSSSTGRRAPRPRRRPRGARGGARAARGDADLRRAPRRGRPRAGGQGVRDGPLRARVQRLYEELAAAHRPR